MVLKFTKLTEIQDCKFIAFHDTYYANLSNGGSQGGYIIVLMDCSGNLSPIAR